MKLVCSVHEYEACSLWCPAIMAAHTCEPPHHFLCPITLEPMHEPVTDQFGFTFERSALIENIKHRNFLCPSTGERYTWTHLQNNFSVSQTIRHCMLAWWREWYYALPNFAEVGKTPALKLKRPLLEASQKFRERLLTENRLYNRHHRSNAVDIRTPVDDVEIEESEDSTYSPSIE